MTRDAMPLAHPRTVLCARATLAAAPVRELASAFCALGNPIRFGVLLAIAGRELCVNDLVQLFEVTQGAVSQHLRRLRQAGLVTTRRAHRNVYYRLNVERVNAVLLGGLRHLTVARAVASAEPAAGPDENTE